MATKKPVRVRIKRVGMDPEGRGLVVLGTAKRDLPIWIGPTESQAIVSRMKRTKLPRPMTHDLFVNALAEVGWEIDKVVVSDLRETTFYGELHLRSGARRKVIDCRPSDGIALALRAKAPICVAPHVFDLAMMPPPVQQPEPAKDAHEGKARTRRAGSPACPDPSLSTPKRSARRSRRTSA